MEGGISAVLRRQGIHENTQAFSQAGIRDCCSSWTALAKSETPTLLPRLDTQQFHPTLDCQICTSVLLNSHSHPPSPFTIPSPLSTFFFFLTTEVCLNKETLLASNIFYVFFPTPSSCPFPSRNHPHVQCLLCVKELPSVPAHPSPPGLQITGFMLPLALQPRLKRGGSKRLWINNANSNGGVMNIHY